jgi:hypothetical protein
MFAFRMPASARSRIHAVRRLYQKCLSENSREARGLRLMRDWLSPSQRLQFDRSGSFDVVGCDSGRRYRVYSERVPNVHELDDAGRPAVGLCFIPLGRLVVGDVMLAQKIALETNEQGALAVANRFRAGRMNRRGY